VALELGRYSVKTGTLIESLRPDVFRLAASTQEPPLPMMTTHMNTTNVTTSFPWQFRWLATILCVGTVLLASSSLQAHMLYVVPSTTDNSVLLVFSDDLFPDSRINMERFSKSSLTARLANGDEVPLKFELGEGRLVARLPSPPVSIHGQSPASISTRTDTPTLQIYYLQYLRSDSPAATGGPQKESRLQIVPVSRDGETRFQLLAEGKPVADAEGSVLLPDETDRPLKTDAEGFTEAFSAPGRYGVTLRVTEPKQGELDGASYEAVRHNASLVWDRQ
jgi:hypothetical protein